jgi:TonB family protein
LFSALGSAPRGKPLDFASAVSPLAPATEATAAAPQRAFDATLGSALAASIAVHLTTFAVLLATGAGVGGGTFALRSGAERPVEVLLATARTKATDGAAAAVLTASAPEALRVSPSGESEPTAAVTSPPASASGQASASGRTGGSRRPRVIVDDRIPRTRFAEALEGGPLADFPREIETPVELPGKLEVPYPLPALEAQREGTVLAWAIVDAQGRVEDVQVVEGPPDLAAAVTAALRQARLIPARNDGAPIRFYITLAVDFRLEARGETTTASTRR